MRNVNKIFRKDVPYDNIKSKIKPGFSSLLKKYIVQKTTGKKGWAQIEHPSRFRVKCHKILWLLVERKKFALASASTKNSIKSSKAYI